MIVQTWTTCLVSRDGRTCSYSWGIQKRLKKEEKNSDCHILTYELLPKLLSLWGQLSSQVMKSLSPSPRLEQFLLWSLIPNGDLFLCIKN